MASGVRQVAAERIAAEKRAIRAEMRSRMAALDDPTVQRAALAVMERLDTEPHWRGAALILAYSATGYELDLWPALDRARAAGKGVALPRFDRETGGYCAALVPEDRLNLRAAAYGILEPPPSAPCIALNRLDFVLVPGVAFDVKGMRLGRGKGFYDRLLAQVEGIKCGVALDQQIVETVPAEAHDIAMNLILTPSRRLSKAHGGS